MAVTAGQVSTAVNEVATISETILETIAALDPSEAVPAEAAAGIAALGAQLATAAIAAFGIAAGTPITVESVTALLPDAAPLDPPDAQS